MTTNAEQFYKAHRRHPRLFHDHFEEAWVHGDLRQIVQALDKLKEDEDPLQAAPDLLKVESNEIYSFNALSDEFIRLFTEELAHFYAMAAEFDLEVRRPNSMNNYGVIVNDIGMRNLISNFQQRYLLPLAQRLFPVEGAHLDDHHSFIVRYQADEDLGLDMHTDDSDVTFNVCLGEQFTGAKLQFCGDMGQPNHRQWTHEYQHQVGRAVLHLGSRRHGAEDIESGTRLNLIVWSHNHAFRQSPDYLRCRRMDFYQKEQGPPSLACLSYTHDRDYQAFQKLPAAAHKLRLRPWCPPVGKEYAGFTTRPGAKRENPIDDEL